MASAAGGSNSPPPSGSKPRGRPPGAKNKAPQNMPLQNTAPQVTSRVLEIPPGMDVVAWVNQFAQANNVSVNVLTGSGMISRVAYGHPSSPNPIIVSEPLNLVYIAGLVNPAEPGFLSFTATMSRFNGSVIGVRPFQLVAMHSVVLTTLVSQNMQVITTDSPIL
ncbi:hypothetical protein DCAR_0626636 [Daucus carota subsp. sativus]|uniref:Uncharacterized protein n=1 Tax=Daucus carota subsp. sativus TaxID=79200 RepID=A0A161YHX2_DAUCS|nr:PREDICTED: AT-hook motif nuclear-localized protein 27-like [Daucus carota subsp. sativus]WOH07207.1 hypothetical protein DCAR_0626636 [Daucus carota subsp. sativus]